MSRSKKSLPESLELLLDTMCNTFGGIMFIALALIVISQLVTKSITQTSQEDYDESVIAAIEERIADLEKKIKALKMEEIKKRLENSGKSPEFIEALEKMMEADAAAAALERQVAKIQEQAKQIIPRAKILEQEIKELKNKVVALEVNYKEKKEELNRKRTALQKELKELKKQLENTQPRNLRFAREESTDLSPYYVLFYDKKIYRYGTQSSPLTSEVKEQQVGTRYIRFVPTSGTGLSSNPVNELNYLFKKVDPNKHFLYIVSDWDSFTTLAVTKEYLRTNGYKVYWNIDPTYTFVLSDSVDHKASF